MNSCPFVVLSFGCGQGARCVLQVPRALSRHGISALNPLGLPLAYGTNPQPGSRPEGESILKRITALAGVLCLVSLFVPSNATAELDTTTVYTSGQEGYHTFRIPALLRTPNYLLAFAEGRLTGGGDSGEIDLVLKRSTDDGKTWSDLSVVAHQKGYTCGNPAPVWDRETKELILLITKNRADAHEGKILTGGRPPSHGLGHPAAKTRAPRGPSRKTSVPLPARTLALVRYGSCHGIQLQSGRLVIPANYSTSPDRADWFSHVLYSDDHGKTWAIGGIHQTHTNESTVAELADGRVYQNMRSYRGENRRRVSYSSDGGLTWTDDATDQALIEPVCQASVLTFAPEGAESRSHLIFSNPASTKRVQMTLRLSTDGGATWPRPGALRGAQRLLRPRHIEQWRYWLPL